MQLVLINETQSCSSKKAWRKRVCFLHSAQQELSPAVDHMCLLRVTESMFCLLSTVLEWNTTTEAFTERQTPVCVSQVFLGMFQIFLLRRGQCADKSSSVDARWGDQG